MSNPTGNPVVDYKRALAYLDTCGLFNEQKLRETNRLSGNVMSESDIQMMLGQAQMIMPKATEPGGMESIKATIRDSLETFVQLTDKLSLVPPIVCVKCKSAKRKMHEIPICSGDSNGLSWNFRIHKVPVCEECLRFQAHYDSATNSLSYLAFFTTLLLAPLLHALIPSVREKWIPEWWSGFAPMGWITILLPILIGCFIIMLPFSILLARRRFRTCLIPEFVVALAIVDEEKLEMIQKWLIQIVGEDIRKQAGPSGPRLQFFTDKAYRKLRERLR
jgi:hypothetical protein